MTHFADRLIEAVMDKKSMVLVGLDPHPDLMPPKLLAEAGPGFAGIGEAIRVFNLSLIDAVCDLVPAVKPQIAFYERFGLEGLLAYLDTMEYARSKGLLVVGDVKRNDISSTAAAYSDAHLGRVMVDGVSSSVFAADAITVNPYFGADGITPFLKDVEQYDKGLFVLVRTSNPSSGELQNLTVVRDGAERKLFEVVGELVQGWGAAHVGGKGYSSVGAVVGATFPEEAAVLRRQLPRTLFLVPGIGAQGGDMSEVRKYVNADGLGALIASSRGVNYAYRGNKSYGENGWAAAAREAVLDMNRRLETELAAAGRRPW